MKKNTVQRLNQDSLYISLFRLQYLQNRYTKLLLTIIFNDTGLNVNKLVHHFCVPTSQDNTISNNNCIKKRGSKVRFWNEMDVSRGSEESNVVTPYVGTHIKPFWKKNCRVCNPTCFFIYLSIDAFVISQVLMVFPHLTERSVFILTLLKDYVSNPSFPKKISIFFFVCMLFVCYVSMYIRFENISLPTLMIMMSK